MANLPRFRGRTSNPFSAAASTNDAPDSDSRFPAQAGGRSLEIDLSVEWVALSSLKANPRNARTHNRQQIAALAESIRTFGWTKPIIVDANSVVVAGHGCLEAASKLGIAQVPVIRRSDLSPEKVRLYALADNKLAEKSGWDRSLLAIELKELETLDLDLSVTGFEFTEIETLFEEHTPAPDASDEHVDAAPDQPVVARAGDVFLAGRHWLMCGDATNKSDVNRLLRGAVPILMVTDPPFGVSYDPEWRHRAGVNRSRRSSGIKNDDCADWTPAWRLFPGAVAYVWHGGLHSGVVQQSLEDAGFEIRAQIVWVKPRLVLSRGDIHWRHEPAYYAVRRGQASNWCGSRTETTVWEVGERSDILQEGAVHPTRKPITLMRRAILNSSRAGQGVYDPFLGSGTTLLAAEKTGRTAFALEIDPKFVDLAVTRWQRATGKDAFLDGTSHTFGEISRERLGQPPREGRRRTVPARRSEPR